MIPLASDEQRLRELRDIVANHAPFYRKDEAADIVALIDAELARRSAQPQEVGDLRAVRSELIKIAAALATGTPLISEPVIPDTAARYVRDRVHIAIDKTADNCKDLAVRLRTVADKLRSALQSRERDGERYRFIRTHQYNGLIDFSDYCDPGSPQALQFDRLIDAALAQGKGKL